MILKNASPLVGHSCLHLLFVSKVIKPADLMRDTKYIKGLNGIRAISLFMVLTTHLGIFDNVSGEFFQNRLFNLFSGYAGVNIFFTLSGFLITRLLYTEKITFNGISLKNFYIRRFLRLLPPLLLFYIAIAVLMLAHAIPSTYKGFLISFFYLYNFVFHQYYTQELGHTWSLAVEEQFYILWPFVIREPLKTPSFSKDADLGVF